MSSGFQLLEASKAINRLQNEAREQAKRDIKLRECWRKWKDDILADDLSNSQGAFNATMGKDMVEALKAYMGGAK